MKTTTLFLVAVGAVSTGVHAGLAPIHLHEWLPLGVAFVAAAVAVGAGVLAVTLRPASAWAARLLGTLLGVVAVAYALTRLAALPPLDPDREPLDALGLCTSTLEVAAGLVAFRLGRFRGRRFFAVTTGGTA